MYTDRGLIVKHIPYSDSSRILKCFTLDKGMTALFIRIPKKGPGRALIQTGSFIEFSLIDQKKSSMNSVKEIKWDQNIPTLALDLEAQNTWLFTLELLNKSLVDNFSLPHLHERIYSYYAHLLYSEISSHGCVSLLNIAASLGVIDLKGLRTLLPINLIADLNKLGWGLENHNAQPSGIKEIFNTEFERFSSHFGIQNMESLSLIEIA